MTYTNNVIKNQNKVQKAEGNHLKAKWWLQVIN